MQIGPRIRIGGTIGHLGQQIKEHVLPSPASLVGNVIGGPVGGLIGSTVNGSLKEDLTKGARNAGIILGGKALFGGGSPIGGDAGGTAAPANPGGIEGAIAKIPGGQQILDAVKSGAAPISALLGFLKDHGGDILAGANVADAAYRQMQADKYAGKAFNLENDAYQQKAPLRMAGIQGMLNPGANTPDLSALRMIAGAGSGNPFAKALPMAGPQAVGNHGPQAPVPMPLGGSTVPQNINNVPSRLVGVPPLPSQMPGSGR